MQIFSNLFQALVYMFIGLLSIDKLISIKYGLYRKYHLLKLAFFILVSYATLYLDSLIVNYDYTYFKDGEICIQKSLILIMIWLNGLDQAIKHTYFTNYAFLVRVLRNCFYDLRYFLLLLSLATLTYTFSFYIIQESPQTISFFNQLQYNLYFFMANIDFTVNNLSQYTSYDQHLTWAFFWILAFYNTIILLNLMIAIITQSYEMACRDEKQIFNYDNLLNINEKINIDFNMFRQKIKNEQLNQQWVIIIEKIDFKQQAPSSLKKNKDKMQKICQRASTLRKQQIKQQQSINKITTKLQQIDFLLNEKIFHIKQKMNAVINRKSDYFVKDA